MVEKSKQNLLMSGVVFLVVGGIGLILVKGGYASTARADVGIPTNALDFLLVFLIAGAIAVSLHRMLRHPVILQEKIDARTQELQGSLIEAWLQKRQLQAAQDHVRGILRSTPDAVVAGTGSGIITEWNDASERLYGWNREQVLGRHVGCLLPPGARPVFEEHADALGSGRTIRVIVPRMRADSSRFVAELTMSGFRDERGNLRSWVTVVRDVTEQQIVRDARAATASDLDPTNALRGLVATLHSSFAATAAGLCAAEDGVLRRMVSVSADGRLLAGEESIPLAKTAAARAIRDRVPVVVRDTDTDPTLGPVRMRWFAILPLVQSGGVVATLTVGFDGAENPTEKTLDLLGKVAGAISQDVANILLYERERETARKLKEVDQIKSIFLSNVSHELRTPLTAICGFAATLDERWDQIDEASRREFVQRVLHKADKLDEMIGTLLDFARLEEGTLEVSLRPCVLIEELQREVAKFDQVQNTHEVVVSGDRGIVALADPQGLSRVVGNLLTNACKFSPPGTRISVRATAARGEAVVSVTDEGMGIPVYEQEQIFQRFYRVQHGDRVVAEGTGIGLAIVKQFVEAQGGRVWLESQLDRGTTFYFTLPLDGESSRLEAPPIEVDAATPSSNGSRPRRVDDYTRVSRPAQ